MTEGKPNFVEDFGTDLKKLAGLKADELKYRSARTLSSALAQVLSYFLILMVLGIVLGLIAYALLQWLNAAVGAPFGTLIVLGVFIVALFTLWLLRKKLFINTFSRIFTEKSQEEADNELYGIISDEKLQESRITNKYNGFKKKINVVNMLKDGLSSNPGPTILATVLSIILNYAIKRKKK